MRLPWRQVQYTLPNNIKEKFHALQKNAEYELSGFTRQKGHQHKTDQGNRKGDGKG